jgi:hypothetical protein
LADPQTVLETLAIAGVAGIVGALWRLSTEHAGMRVALDKGIGQVVDQIKALRAELGKDVERLEDVLDDQKNVLNDHENRIRVLEKDK